MTTTKLLTGVAIAALLSGAAMAQNVEIINNGTSANLPAGISGNTPAINFIADEFQPATAPGQLTGTIVVDSTLTDNVFATTSVTSRVRVRLSLTNAAFTTAGGATYAAINATDDAANQPPAVNGAADGAAGHVADDESCNLTGAPVNGGGIGGTFVEFQSPAPSGAAATAAEIDFRICGVSSPAVAPEVAATGQVGTFSIPVQRLANSAPIGLTITYTEVSAAGVPVPGGVSQSATFNFASPASAWDGPGSTPSHGFGTAVTALASGAGVLPASGSLGSIGTDFQTTADADGNLAAGPSVPILDDTGVAIAITDLFTGGSVAINFQGGVGSVNGVDISTTSGDIVCTGPVANVFTCPVTAQQLANFGTVAGNGAITYTTSGSTVTPEQDVQATLTTSTQANYVAPGFGPSTIANIEHDDGLSTANATTSAFDWVRFGSGGTESNFRLRFANADDVARVTQVRVAFNNGNGVTAPVPPSVNYVLIPEGAAGVGFQRQGATITFNSGALGAAAGATGNADITGITVQYSEGTPPAAFAAPEANRQLVNRNPSSFVATPGMNDD